MNNEQSFDCIFCKETFDNKEELQVHFRKHGDPSFNTTSRFKNVTPASSNESIVKGVVNCDVCSQAFPTISKAITHKHKVHPDHDAKYFCPWCGKLFTMKHLYNVHIDTSHDNQEKPGDLCFHCDCCDVDFFMPSAMLYHNKFFHRQETDIPDVGTSKKIHLVNQEVIPIYYCAFCGEEYQNKVNLFKHMTDDHGDENQSPDEVLRCPLCEAVFYHLDAYEIHLTFHSTEDLYSVQNPLCNEVTDFSLETVQPLFEKVENLDSTTHNEEENPESAINSIGLENFLELAMDQSDNSNNIKVKKHKKHKKSKKAAITLDEFLSMNTDVFGEDIDIQGVEEVPSMVVKKHLKSNKKPTNTEKSLSSAEIAKLKRQGIIIKKKSAKSLVKDMKLKSGQVLKLPESQIIKDSKQQSNTDIKTSNEMLSKLINQSNNQIRIVKKSSTNNLLESEQSKDTMDEQAKSNGELDSDIDKSNLNKTSPELDGAMFKNKENTPSPILTQQDKTLTLSTPENVQKSNESSELTDCINKESNSHLDRKEKNKGDDLAVHLSLEISAGKDEAVDKSENKNPLKLSDSIPDDIEDHHCSPNREYESPDEDFNASDNELQDNCGNNKNKTEIIGTNEKSLSHLKHLSHLITIKPVSKNKNTINLNMDKNSIKSVNIMTDNKKTLLSIKDKELSETDSIPLKPDSKEEPKNTLINFNKNVTIKSVTKPSKPNVQDVAFEKNSETDEESDLTNVISKEISRNENLTVKKIKVESTDNAISDQVANATKPLRNVKNNSISQRIVKSSSEIKTDCKNIESPNHNIKNAMPDILKRLPDIQTKPISVQQAKLPPSNVKENTTNQSENRDNKVTDVIEIFDVDDSEDEFEGPNSCGTKTPSNIIKTPVVDRSKSIDALKNLGKHLTIKSVNHQPTVKNIKIEKNIETEHIDEYDQNNFMDDTDDMEVPIRIKHAKVINPQSSHKVPNQNVLPSTIKNLSKNITVTSNKYTNSQSTYPEHEEFHSSDEYVDFANEASDSDSCPGNIKITELDGEVSDKEHDSETVDKTTTVNEPIIESPDDSCSSDKQLNQIDFESEIQANSVPNSQQSTNTDKNSLYLNNLKTFNKNLTIKSVNKTSQGCDQFSPNQSTNCQDQPVQKKVLNPEMPSKLVEVSQLKDFPNKNMTIKKNNQILGQVPKSVNQNIGDVNDINSVNREVRVERFQTKTVIQEITTTVTKTIKTVNQTVKKEVRNSSQTNSSMVCQKVQGMIQSPRKNLQGVVVRNAVSNVPVRFANTNNLVRPVSAVVRPSKQLVQVRPSANVARMSTPRMQVAKRVPPPQNSQMLGKTLKISPNAMASTQNKRPNAENVSGPFSCFKKPKESLIPGADFPSFGDSSDNSGSQVVSASHTTSSNFSSTMKIAKGNAVMTAIQTKSEVSSTSQHISRLCNTAGLTVKASQSHQSQVQENSESSPMKRTTLEAIQKLQKQGLLIKKPRLENEDSVCSEEDDNL